MTEKLDQPGKDNSRRTRDSDDGEFLRVIRRHLSFRNDEYMKRYIESRASLAGMLDLPHENPMAVIVEQLWRLAGRNNPVVIDGPVGAGRFAVAKALRDLDSRSETESVTLSCAGTDYQRLTSLARAGCTLILREIDKASPPFQQALLGLMDETSGMTPRRIICTASSPLADLVANGSFDPVLGRRLGAGARIIVPSLAKRRWDIPLIVIEALRELDPSGSIRFISYAALHMIANFEWTGEIEQLRHVLDGAVRETLDRGKDLVTLVVISDQFKQVTPTMLPVRTVDPFGFEDPLGVNDTYLLHRVHSPEVAAFFKKQQRDQVYSEPYPTEREQEYAGWHNFDHELWTGCYAVTGHPVSADHLYDQVRNTGLAALPVTNPPAGAEVTGQVPVGDLETIVRMQESREWHEREELKLRVNRVVLDDDYGVNMFPSRVDIGGGATLIRLDFSNNHLPRTACPEWLTDDLWVFRDSWNVPLEWADTRILFDVGKMAEDLKAFLKTEEPIAIPAAVHDEVVETRETAQKDVVAGGENIFRREGIGWTIEFEGKKISTPDGKGAFLVSILLKSPGRHITAQDLRALSNPAISDGVPEEHSLELDPNARVDRPEDEDDKLLTREARRKLAEKIQESKEDYQAAVDRDDFDEAERIERERDNLIAAQAKAIGLRGKKRKLLPDEKRAVDALRSAIRRFYLQVEHQHTALTVHLKSSIRIWGICWYLPEPPRSWSD